MRAHDVRHLCVCSHCEQMGDDRSMIVSQFPESLHPACFVERYGEEAIFEKLSRDEHRLFRLSDVTHFTMQRLLEQP